MNEIFIAYELEHLKEAVEQAKSGKEIICLNFLLECECEKRGIPFTPLRKFVDSETGEEEWWILSHSISREWYRLPDMNFLEYGGIRLAEAPEPIMQAYLAKIFYFLRIFLFLKSAYPNTYFLIPSPTIKRAEMIEFLGALQPLAVLDAARMAKLIRGSEYKDILPRKYTFIPISWKSYIIPLYNFLIGLLPQNTFKVYISGYWPHAEHLVTFMRDTDIILLETKKLFDIPWKQRWKNRIRVFYSHRPISNKEEYRVRQITLEFVKKWENSKNKVLDYLGNIRKDLDWNPVLEACEHFMMYAPRMIADINILRKIMEKERPDIVLQMASVGGPHHYFFLMARMAKQFNIPSVELQHATVTIDPRSVFCRIETDYLFTYGEIINSWHRRIGNGHKNLISVGSPRFDQYINNLSIGIKKGKELMLKMGLDIKRPILFVAVPFSETYASAIDSYQLIDFFETIHKVQEKTPDLQILFKCRGPKWISVTKEYLNKLFTLDWVITGDEDIFPILCASDAVICNNSTIIYQAVLAKKPLVLHPWKHFDSYHAKIYAPHIPLIYSSIEAIEILHRIFTDPSYCDELLAKQEEFLSEYSFDGKSSERVAELLKKLSMKKKHGLFLDTHNESINRVSKFIISGAIGVSVNLSIFHLLVVWGVSYLLGSILALLISIIIGFILQKYWTFENQHYNEIYYQFILYLLLALSNLFINTLVVYFLIDKLHVFYLLAQLVSAAIVAFYSFFIYRLFIFKSNLC